MNQCGIQNDRFSMKTGNNQLVITGIGTDVGKTVTSAIVAQALEATYWKPVQAGDLDRSDSIKIRDWINAKVSVLPEAFRLTQPMSPHAAAAIDGITIKIEDFQVPEVLGNLIIEGAGGLLVPINSEGLFYADVFAHWQLPVIVVSRNYIGSINHTLLTLAAMQQRRIPIAGIIFTGHENPETETMIVKTSGVQKIAGIPEAEVVDKSFVQQQAEVLRKLPFFANLLNH